MRQIYKRIFQAYICRIVNEKAWTVYSAIIHICANCSILSCILLQNAESLCISKKLFLIRSAASGLTVILPNMDRMAGGELE